jgi:beta-lactamase regulating signal transducer with metallopeptidase domain
VSELLVLRALLFAGECFAASVLLPLLAFAVTAMVRRAALRHLIWTAMFGVLAVLPVVALLLPPRRIVEHVAAPVAQTAPILVPAIAPPPPALVTPENGVILLVALWLAGLAWQMLRLGIGGLGLMRLRRASAPFAGQTGSGCDVRLAAGETGPSTFGILRPIVLLPRSAASWPAARLEAVLRHECAHVVRRDTAAQFVARLACALYWPNPLLWLGLRAARREAEIAADDAVLASGMTPSAYAAELVALAAESRGLAPGIAMARPPLAARVQSVLAENVSRKGVSRMDIAKTVCCGLAATLLLGTARFDFAVAQDAAPAAAAPKAERSVDLDVQRQADAARQKDAEAMRQAGAAMRDAARAREQAGEAMRDAATARAKADADRAQADEVRHAAERMRQEMTQIQPEIDRAMANAHIEEQVAKALADAHIQEAVVKAMADAHVDAVTAKAVADAHIEEKIAAAMASVRPVIRAAIARAAMVAPIPPAPPPPAPVPPPYAPR